MTAPASYWRLFAQETRALAEKVIDLENKRIVLEIADKYDWLAENSQREQPLPNDQKE